MAAWPELDELKQLLDITSEDWDGEDDYGETTRLSRLLEAAIAYVQFRIGDWDEDEDIPSSSQSQAALRMAELLAQRPEPTPQAVHDRTFERLLLGSRRKFGVA